MNRPNAAVHIIVMNMSLFLTQTESTKVIVAVQPRSHGTHAPSPKWGGGSRSSNDLDVLQDSVKPASLSWMVGEWIGTRTEPGNDYRAPVLSQVKSILGGAGEEETLDIKTPNGMYRGLYLHAVEARSGKSVLMYINARRREFVRLEGITNGFGGEWRGVPIEGPRRSKLVYEHDSKDHWRRTQYMSTDSGATWKVLFVDELFRGKGQH